MRAEQDIAHESPNHWVARKSYGYEVYRTGVTHSTRVAQIGFTGAEGLARAVRECERREALLAGAAS